MTRSIVLLNLSVGYIICCNNVQLAKDGQKMKKEVKEVIWWGPFFNKIKNQPHFRLIYKKVHPIPHQANFFFVVIPLVRLLVLTHDLSLCITITTLSVISYLNAIRPKSDLQGFVSKTVYTVKSQLEMSVSRAFCFLAAVARLIRWLRRFMKK